MVGKAGFAFQCYGERDAGQLLILAGDGPAGLGGDILIVEYIHPCRVIEGVRGHGLGGLRSLGHRRISCTGVARFVSTVDPPRRSLPLQKRAPNPATDRAALDERVVLPWAEHL